MNLRAVWIYTNSEDERERRSYEDMSALQDAGMPLYMQHSPLYTGEIPEPRLAPDRPFTLTPAHYGCYCAHRDAFDTFKEGTDGLLMFECDAIWTVPIDEVMPRINRAYEACIKGDLTAFTFGPKHNGKTTDMVGDDVIVITQFIETHAYLIPSTAYDYFEDLFSRPWDALDFVYTVYMHDRDRKRIGTFRDRPIAVQATGNSLITGQMKTEDHWKYKIYA